MKNEIFCGYAQANITPTMPVYLDGFAARSGQSTGVRDPLYAKVLYFEDGKAERCLMIVFDMIGFDKETASIVKTAAIEASDLSDERIMLLATHTHSGPAAGTLFGLPKCYEYWNSVACLVKDAVKEAMQNKKSVGLYLEEHPIKIGVNRRAIVDGKVVIGVNPDKPCDDNMRILRFTENGRTVGALCNASCHPVNHGAENLRVTADYPSRLHAYANEKDDFFAIYTNSACGNINPLRPYGDDAEANLIACGDEVVKVLKTALENEPAASYNNTKLTCLYDTVKLPIEIKVDLEGAKEKYAYWQNRVENEADKKLRYRALVSANWYKIQIETLEKDEEPSVDIPFRLFSLGEVAVLSLPFELFCETRARLCESFERITGKKLIVCCCADYVRAYLPDALALSEGGYETESACMWYSVPGKYTPKSEPTLISACERLFERLKEISNG